MTERIRVYMCRKSLGEITKRVPVPDQSEVTEIDVENQIVKTKIRQGQLPEGCNEPIRNLIRSYLKPDDWDDVFGVCLPECWFYDNPNQSFITYTRGIQVEEFGGPVTRIRTYPLITYRHPDHCQWIETQLAVFGPPRINPAHGDVIAFTNPQAPGPIPGPIPGNDPDDQFTGGGTTEYEVFTNEIVPGMRVSVIHLFGNTERTVRIFAGEVWWCSCCLTGGTITSVIGSGEYRVSVANVVQKAWSSDRIDWAVGDWVFLSPMAISPNCSDPNRNEPCYNACPTDPNIPLSRTFVILPLKIGQDGA